jgi:adenine-specific DNA-methyltransferase
MSPRLELVWPGKDKFLLVPKDKSGQPVWVEPGHPAAREVRLTDFTVAHGEVNEDDPYQDNLLFTGDSLDVLRALREVPEYAHHYRGKVKLVYIDPPFNTGQTFTHFDDWMEHSTWLSFMRDRLLLIKDLLAADGSVWVHLDDAEVHRMRCLMDEVFGSENFVATVVWQKTTSARNDTRGFSTDQDPVLVYAASSSSFTPNGLTRSAASEKAYANPDSDPRGPWREGDYKTARGSIYPILHPVTGADVLPPPGSCWRFSEDTHKRNLEQGLLWWGKTGNYTYPKVKRFRSAVGETVVPQTLWLADAVDTTRRAKQQIKDLFPGMVPFDTPKPERLLERVIHIGSNPGDIVLDCFGGSGTTAAVAHKMGRRWLTTEVHSATVAAFTAPRLIKVVEAEDLGGITKAVGWQGGGGFRQVTVAPSMYEKTQLGVLLADWAANGRFARAVAGQLGFEWQAEKHAPFCGVRGRMRLAVFDGAVGIEEAREVIAALDERERVTIVAKVVLPGVEEFVAEQSKGSRVKKAPRDLLAGQSTRVRKREEGTA